MAAPLYDEWSARFLEVYGPTFQSALVTTPGEREHPRASNLALARRAGIEDGQRILDAGCGVGGPALDIAAMYAVEIDGVTVSSEQAALGAGLVDEAGLADRVRIHLADYHHLPFPGARFDRAIMFEAICYSDRIGSLVAEVFRVLEPGGVFYLKDVFLEEGDLSEAALRSMDTYHEIWGCTATPRLSAVAQAMSEAGFVEVSGGELPSTGMDHFFAGMFEPGSLELNDVGRRFLAYVEEFPIYWGEVMGAKPAPPLE